MTNDERNEFLVELLRELSAIRHPKYEEWQKTVGVDTEPFADDWEKRISDPRNQQKESYLQGLMEAENLLYKKIIATNLMEGTANDPR